MSRTQVGKLAESVSRSLKDVGSLLETIDGDENGRALFGRFAAFGLIGTLPLWQGLYQYCGLRVLPDRPVAEWPGVLVSANGFGQTITADSKNLLGAWVLHISAPHQTISNEIARRVEELVTQGKLLHEALGGASSDWRHFVETFVSGEVAFAKAAGSAEFECHFGALARALDQSDAFKAYADWLDTWREGAFRLPETSRMGCWRRLAVMRAWRDERSAVRGAAELAEDLYRIVEETAGFDASVRLPASWGSLPGSKSPRVAIAELARALAGSAPIADPVRQVVVDRVARVGVDYDGLAHTEAAALIAESGQPRRAWEILCCAAWWMSSNVGGVPSAIFDGLAMLCDENGWMDAGWVVEQSRSADR